MKMKCNIAIISLICFFIASCAEEKKPSRASSDHGNADHSHESNENSDTKRHAKKAGPHGGRVVSGSETDLEFLLREDGIVQIAFLDKAGNEMAPAEQEVSLVGGDRSDPITLQFAREGEVLLSSKALPSLNNMPVILQIKETPLSQTIREKFNLNLSACPECEYKEYACICDHGEGHHDNGQEHGHGEHTH